MKIIPIEVYPHVVHVFIALHVLLLLFGSFPVAASADERCRELIKTLEQDTLRLKEYVTALQNAHRERDFQMVTLLNSEIDETLKQIRAGEAESPGRNGFVILRTGRSPPVLLSTPLHSDAVTVGYRL